ncbi:MAG: hypothetical protein GY917_08880, partial [Planctomycetaceae bacterium]|nr:hypothetical protein [Planctomycetaceae bacterium]
MTRRPDSHYGHVILLLTIVIAFTSTNHAYSADPLPRYTIYRTNGPIKVDGRLDE